MGITLLRKKRSLINMAFEFEILNFFQELHTPVLTWIMRAASRLGDVGFIWILLAVILLLIPKTRKIGMLVSVALILDVITCNLILKPLVARTRPYDVNTAIELLIAAPKDFSFPSGHTAASFAAVSALWFAKEKKFWIPALVLAVLIAFSRMYFYVHYPTDVLGGALLGILCGWMADKLLAWGKKEKNHVQGNAD